MTTILSDQFYHVTGRIHRAVPNLLPVTQTPTSSGYCLRVQLEGMLNFWKSTS